MRRSYVGLGMQRRAVAVAQPVVNAAVPGQGLVATAALARGAVTAVRIATVSAQTLSRAVSVTAGATAVNSLTWPTANRIWLFDPDYSGFRTVVSGKVSQLRDLGAGATFTMDEPTTGRLPLVTKRGRSVLACNGASIGISGSAAVVQSFEDLRGPATFFVVWIAPGVVPGGGVRLFGAHDYAGDQYNLTQIDTASSGRVAWVAHSDADVDFTVFASAASPFAPNGLYLFTVVNGSDGVVKIYVNGSECGSYARATSPVTVAAASDVTSAYIGFEDDAVGFIGATGRYSVAYTGGDVSALWVKAQAIYAG